MTARLLLPLVLLLPAVTTPGQAAAFACDAAQSRIDVIVKATVDSFTGRLSRFDPEITFDDTGRVSSARLRFRFLDLLTGKEKRDRAMHEWQHTDQFPDGEFKLDSLAPASGGSWLAQGRLTLHGTTQPLSFPVTIVSQGEVCALDGEAVVDTREFGLPVIRLLGLLKVDPLVHVRFHLQGRREAKS